MKVVIDISEDRYADIQMIASVQLERRWPTPEQIIAKGVPINEPRTGKWVDDGTEFGCCCSECGSTLDDYFDGLTEDVRLMKIPDFCLNCGADMRGGQE